MLFKRFVRVRRVRVRVRVRGGIRVCVCVCACVCVCVLSKSDLFFLRTPCNYSLDFECPGAQFQCRL